MRWVISKWAISDFQRGVGWWSTTSDNEERVLRGAEQTWGRLALPVWEKLIFNTTINHRQAWDRQTDRQMNLRNATYNEAVEGGPDSSSWWCWWSEYSAAAAAADTRNVIRFWRIKDPSLPKWWGPRPEYSCQAWLITLKIAKLVDGSEQDT